MEPAFQLVGDNLVFVKALDRATEQLGCSTSCFGPPQSEAYSGGRRRRKTLRPIWVPLDMCSKLHHSEPLHPYIFFGEQRYQPVTGSRRRDVGNRVSGTRGPNNRRIQTLGSRSCLSDRALAECGNFQGRSANQFRPAPGLEESTGRFILRSKSWKRGSARSDSEGGSTAIS